MTLPKDFRDYLTDINASAFVRQRIEELLRFIRGLVPKDTPVTHIFVSAYVDKEGATHYESVWFFTRDRAFESQNFLRRSATEVDCVIIEKSIRRWAIATEKFRPDEETSPASRLNLTADFGVESESLGAEMKAAGANCSYLYKIFTDLIVINLVGAPGRYSGTQTTAS